MAFVLSEYIESWFKNHPGHHRTDQQGNRIVCPIQHRSGYPAEPLHDRPSKTSRCTICHAHLGHAQLIIDRDHPGEYQWPNAL